MTSKEYDLMFEQYLESEACDQLEETTLEQIKGAIADTQSDAFRAGWDARGRFEGLEETA